MGRHLKRPAAPECASRTPCSASFFGLRARPATRKSSCFISRPTFVTLRPWKTHAFGFRLRANAPEGQKRFPISSSVASTTFIPNFHFVSVLCRWAASDKLVECLGHGLLLNGDVRTTDPGCTMRRSASSKGIPCPRLTHPIADPATPSNFKLARWCRADERSSSTLTLQSRPRLGAASR